MKKLAYYGIMIFLIPFILLLLELGMRVLGYGYSTEPFLEHETLKGFYYDNPEFHYKYYPSSSHTVQKAYTPNFFQLEKSPKTLRGIIIGGSSVQGFPFESNHSFEAMAEHLLNQAVSDNEFEILNLGNSAMSSFYVKDAVSKIGKYNPDFLIIYFGHNEYFGTLNAINSTAENINLNLFLKESRLFQIIFNLISPERKPGQTLMGNQVESLLQVEIIAEKELSLKQAFHKNLESILQQSESLQIPLIIMTPISNIIDFPPFSIDRNLSPWGSHSFNEKKLIRENDLLPFRAKNWISEQILTIAEDRATVLNTHELLIESHGEHFFSNNYFIDHLHFNFNGNLEMAKILSNQLLKMYSRDVILPDITINRLKSDVHMTPIQELAVYNKINSLLDDFPFAGMEIPYQRNIFPASNIPTEYNLTSKLLETLRNTQFKDWSEIIIPFYLEQNRIDLAIEHVQSLRFLFPSSADSLAHLAILQAISGQQSKALKNANAAMTLSNHSNEIKNQLSQVFSME